MTPKQADFVRLYIELGNASEAYKRAYNSTGKPNTLHRKANDLLKHPEVKKELETIKAQAQVRNQVTIDSILQELEQARQAALKADTPQCSAAVTATMSKAKLLGLVVDKSESNTKLLTPPIFNVQPVKAVRDLTDEELKAELKKYGIDYQESKIDSY